MPEARTPEPEIDRYVDRYRKSVRLRTTLAVSLAVAIVLVGGLVAVWSRHQVRSLGNVRNATSYIAEGIQEAASGNTAAALVAFDKASDLDPQSAVPLTLKGKLQNTLGQKSEAMRTLELAVSTDPNYAPAHVELARVYSALEMKRNAEFQVKEALRVDPSIRTKIVTDPTLKALQ